MYRPSQDREVDLDIRDLLGAVGQSFWKLLLISFLLGCLTFIALSFVKPRYSSEAQLILKPEASVHTKTIAERSLRGAGTLTASMIRGQIQVVRSRDLLAEVATKLRLDRVPELKGDGEDQSWLDKLGGLFSVGSPTSAAPAIETVINEMDSRLKVYPVNLSNVLAVQFRSNDAVLSKNIANSVAQTYLERLQNTSVTQRSAAANKWKAVVQDTEAQLEQAEREMRAHMAKHNITQLPNRGGTLLQDQIRRLSQEIGAEQRRATNAQTAADELTNLLKQGGDISSSAYVTKSPMFERLSGQRDLVQQQLDEAGATLGRGHPRMKQLRSRLQRLNGQMQTALKKIVARSKNDALLSSRRVEQKKAQLTKLVSQNDNTNPEQAKLIKLQVKASSLRTNLAASQRQLVDAQTTSGSVLAPVTAGIISKAHIATGPYFPKLLPMSLLAMLAAFLLGLGYIVIRALMATTTTAVDYWREASHEFEGRLLTHRKEKPSSGLLKDEREAS